MSQTVEGVSNMERKELRIRRLIVEATDQGLRPDLDLWPAIRGELRGGQDRTQGPAFLRGGSLMRKTFAFLIVAIAFLVVAIGAMIAVPAARATAESVVRRLGLAFVDTTAPEERNATVVKLEASPVPGGRLMSREEIERQAPFQVRTPTWLPEGLALAGGNVSNDEQKAQVYLEYRLAGLPASSETPCLMLAIYAGSVGAPPLLAASQEVAVEVHGQQAIYVHGGWRDDGQGDPQVAIGGTLQWDSSLDSAWLTWEEGELTYLLQAHGLELDLDQMIRIAESLE